MYEEIQKSNEKISLKKSGKKVSESLPKKKIQWNQPVQNDTKKRPIIQKVGEQNAVDKTLRMQRNVPSLGGLAGNLSPAPRVYRGNKRADIIDSNGNSLILVNVMRDKLNRGELNMEFENQGVPQPNQAQMVFIEAKIAEILGAGNCVEFSKVIYTYLLEGTIGQWVHKCSLIGQDALGQNQDHALIVTNTSQLQNMQTDNLRLAWVSDGWRDIACPLIVYLARYHLTRQNIQIDFSEQADGASRYAAMAPGILNAITAFVDKVRREAGRQDENRENFLRNARGGNYIHRNVVD